MMCACFGCSSIVIIRSSKLGSRCYADCACRTAGRDRVFRSDVTTAACWPPLRKRSPCRSGRRPSPSPARTGDHSTLRRRCDPRRTSVVAKNGKRERERESRTVRTKRRDSSQASCGAKLCCHATVVGSVKLLDFLNRCWPCVEF